MILVECQHGSRRGTRMPVTAGKPLTFRIPVPIGDDEQVTVELVGPQVVFTNRSHRASTVNGQATRRSVLANGDSFTIGKDGFRLVIEGEQDATSTQSLDLSRLVMPAPSRCSVCEGAWTEAGGWTDGAHRLCAACLAKGVRPQNLARLPDEPEVVEPERIRTPLPAVVTPPPPAESDSERLRNVRRISATRAAVVDDAPRGGLFSKVSAVFAGRAGRQALERLEAERRNLLGEAGRLVLAGVPWGLPDDLPARLLKGEAVSLVADDLDRPALERWRAERERLARLDAEIAAARRSLGLGADPEAVAPAPLLRPQVKAHQERAFASMDGLMTEEMPESQVETATEVKDASSSVSPGRISARKRPIKRHR